MGFLQKGHLSSLSMHALQMFFLQRVHVVPDMFVLVQMKHISGGFPAISIMAKKVVVLSSKDRWNVQCEYESL